jgi:hypothetical protein
MLQIDTDPFFDLVAHTFSYLPLGDNSNLFCPEYIQWANSFLSSHPLRTLTQDAELLSSLYKQNPGAYHLQFFSFFYDDLASFEGTLSSEPPENELQHLPNELTELFRIALWGEIKAGYFRLREEQVLPVVADGFRLFAEALMPLCERWPGLAQVRWRLSHPLRSAGRLWPEKNLIVVGLPGVFGVETREVVMQGCHEYFLSEVQRFAPDGIASAERALFDDPSFYGAEITALSIGAICWRGTEFEDLFASFIQDISLDGLINGALIPSRWAACFEQVQHLLLGPPELVF